MNTASGRLPAALRAAVRAGTCWKSLEPSDRLTYTLAWWTLAEGRLRQGLPWVRRHDPSRSPRPNGQAQTARLLAIFRLAARTHLFNPTCLPRSLALQKYLARHGVASDLRLGLRRGRQGFEGHAWIEHLGVPLDDANRVGSYVALEWTR